MVLRTANAIRTDGRNQKKETKSSNFLIYSTNIIIVISHLPRYVTALLRMQCDKYSSPNKSIFMNYVNCKSTKIDFHKFFCVLLFQSEKFILIVLLLIALSWPIDSYGFDAGASCSEKTTRRGRAQLLRTIPCDLTRQAYCNLPGNMYPWNAVRRFVHENQGLMKRMYGDVRHISVLRTEINNNDIDVNDAEEAAARYSRTGWKRNKYIHSDTTKTKNSNVLSESSQRRTGANRGNTKSRNSSRASTATRSTTSTSTTKRTTVEPSTHLPAIELQSRSSNSSETMDADNLDKEIVATVEEIFVQLQAEEDASTQANNLLVNVTEKSVETTLLPEVIAPNLAANRTEAATISTTLRIFGVTRNQDSTTFATPTQSTNTESTTITSRPSSPTKNSTQDDDNLIRVDDDVELADSSAAESTPDETIVDLNGTVPVKAENAAGQLYQDVAEKEEPIVMSSRGV